MTQEEAAEALDIELRTFQRIEAGTKIPTGELVFRMMTLYKCELTDLLSA